MRERLTKIISQEFYKIREKYIQQLWGSSTKALDELWFHRNVC